MTSAIMPQASRLAWTHMQVHATSFALALMRGELYNEPCLIACLHHSECQRSGSHGLGLTALVAFPGHQSVVTRAGTGRAVNHCLRTSAL